MTQVQNESSPVRNLEAFSLLKDIEANKIVYNKNLINELKKIVKQLPTWGRALKHARKNYQRQHGGADPWGFFREFKDQDEYSHHYISLPLEECNVLVLRARAIYVLYALARNKDVLKCDKNYVNAMYNVSCMIAHFKDIINA